MPVGPHSYLRLFAALRQSVLSQKSKRPAESGNVCARIFGAVERRSAQARKKAFGTGCGLMAFSERPGACRDAQSYGRAGPARGKGAYFSRTCLAHAERVLACREGWSAGVRLCSRGDCPPLTKARYASVGQCRVVGIRECIPGQGVKSDSARGDCPAPETDIHLNNRRERT